MGRKSSLTPDQWIEVERRILVEGEAVFAVAAEFGINESSIRRKIKPNSADKAERAQNHHPELRDIAADKVRADTESKRVSEQIATLPYAKQQIVSDLARKLTNISEHMASGAEYSAATYHRLAGIAHMKTQNIDDTAPLTEETVNERKDIASIMRMANEAAEVPLGLLKANKEAVDEINKSAEKDVPAGLSHFYGE